MTDKIALQLNNLELVKYALFKDYQLPQELAIVNLTQERILMTVKNSVNSSMVSISRAIGLEKGPFSQTVDKLENLGLIERIRSTVDRREIFLKLTEKGIHLTNEIENSMEMHFKERTKHLSIQEHQEFLNALKILNTTAKILISKS